MTVRPATADDLPTLYELWREFEAEVPEAPYREVDPEKEDAEVREYVERHLALVAEHDGGPVGFALAKLETKRICLLSDIYVRPDWRSRGVGRELLTAVVRWSGEQGAEVLTLGVLATNPAARSFYYRLGFQEESFALFSPVPALADRLARVDPGASFGSIHVQTDDVAAVVRAAEIYVPRLPGGSNGTVVLPPRNGWTAVYDELCDREPDHAEAPDARHLEPARLLRRPHGRARGGSRRPLRAVRAWACGRRVRRRFRSSTGRCRPETSSGSPRTRPSSPASPAPIRHGCERSRETPPSPTDLPPPPELLASLASVLGVEGATYGHAHAGSEPGAIVVER